MNSISRHRLTDRGRPRHAVTIAFLLALVVPSVRVDAGKDKDVSAELARAVELLSSAREDGVAHIQNGDKKAKKRAKKKLEQAHKILKKAYKSDRKCGKCVEHLTAVHFYRTWLGIDKGYKKVIKSADDGLERFPDEGGLAFYRGYAYFQQQDFKQASRDLNLYLLLSVGNPEAESQARALLAQAQQHFLNNWNNQSDYYNSKESRLVAYNAQTKQSYVALQITPQLELNLGGQAFAAITSQAPPIQDAETISYLQGLVDHLVQKTPGSHFTYKVTLVDSPEVNAVTPPGHIIVYRGLLEFAETEAELAAVLSHELAHNYGHHSARRLLKATQTQLIGNSIASAINPQAPWKQLATRLGMDFAANLVLKAYSRFEEKEADLYGSHILFNAGYDPTAMSSFFLKLYEANPKQPLKFMSTHPPAPDRVNYVTDYLDSFPLEQEFKSDSDAYRQVRSRYGRANANRGGVLPPPLP